MKADLASVAMESEPAVELRPASHCEEHPDARMKLRYGFNETLGWRPFALGPGREQIWARLRDVQTGIVRIFAFAQYTPDPATEWESFAAYVQAVLNAGAVPMVTFVNLPQPFHDPGSVVQVAGLCGSLVAKCVDLWGGDAVSDWAWSVGNKPNSAWITGAMTFDNYRRIYEEVAQAIRSRLDPFLAQRRPMIGGPSVDGFQPFWMDWIWRFVNEIDNSLIGFVAWNRYGDWRQPGDCGAPADELIFRRLLMSRTPEYERRAQSIARALKGRGLLNICSELNAHAHHEPSVSAPFNRTTFGAAYYGSALIHLMRGGADAEMLWTGTDDSSCYGAMDQHGWPTPVYHAKRLCAAHVRYG
ncbi:MAG TPA: hypothetical protein VKE70_33375, partial [Candidatus Solibacter sp.]|nr:hypothetical protein [Candidatus Solibacter sp.]